MSQKLLDAALRRAVAHNNGELLWQAADSLLINAASGVQWAVQMLADRLDGKPQQSVSVEHKRSIDDLTLDELRDRVAALLAGDAASAQGQGQPSGVH